MSDTSIPKNNKTLHGTMELRMHPAADGRSAATEYYMVTQEGQKYRITHHPKDFRTHELLRRAATESQDVRAHVQPKHMISSRKEYAGTIPHETLEILLPTEETPRKPLQHEGILRIQRKYDRATHKWNTEYYVTTYPSHPSKGRFRIEDDELDATEENRAKNPNAPTLFNLAHHGVHACFSVADKPSTNPSYEGWVERGSLRILHEQNKEKGSHER
jgi:hypothetical protein